MSEGIVHHKVKEQVAHALQTTPGVTNVEIEWRFGPVQADVSFCLGGKRGAVEIQLSDKPRAADFVCISHLIEDPRPQIMNSAPQLTLAVDVT